MNILDVILKGSNSTWLDFDLNGPPIPPQWGVLTRGMKPGLTVTMCRNSVEQEVRNFGSTNRTLNI
jgi:hypothetical protein